MINMRLCLVTVSVSLFCSSVVPAIAQIVPVGISNAGGANNSNQQGFSSLGAFVNGSSGYNSVTLSQAQALQSRLAAAQAAVDNAKPETGSGPRRYVRNPQPCNCGGGSAEQAELDKVKAEVAAFLESVKNPSGNLLNTPQPTGGRASNTPIW